MNYLLIGLAMLIAAAMSSIVIPQIASVSYDKKLFDEPNERKVHKKATPRLGGISFAPIIFFSLALVLGLNMSLMHVPVGANRLLPNMVLLFCGLTLLDFVGIKDDLTGVRYRTKFIFQIAVASLIPISGFWINNLYGFLGIQSFTPWIGIPLTIFITVLIINAINLIDGIDGLASGLCCISLVTLGTVFFVFESWIYSLLAFVTFSVLVPFFIFNVFGKQGKRKIFMGDTGSLSLGYIIAFLAICLTSAPPEALATNNSALVIAFCSLMVPVFDVCRVMIVRARNNKNMFLPDKNHIHHKFMKMGYGPRQSMVRILMMSATLTLLNILLSQAINCTFIFLIDTALWLGLQVLIDSIITKKEAEAEAELKMETAMKELAKNMFVKRKAGLKKKVLELQEVEV